MDLIGIGALNIDYVIRAKPRGADPGTETAVDAATILAALAGHPPLSVRPGGSAFNAILELADVLLVNARELAELGAFEHRTTVVKRPHGATIHRRGRADVVVPHTPLRPGEIVDATGAGDVFAAGVLAALAGGRPLVGGVRDGMSRARALLTNRDRNS